MVRERCPTSRTGKLIITSLSSTTLWSSCKTGMEETKISKESSQIILHTSGTRTHQTPLKGLLLIDRFLRWGSSRRRRTRCKTQTKTPWTFINSETLSRGTDCTPARTRTMSTTISILICQIRARDWWLVMNAQVPSKIIRGWVLLEMRLKSDCSRI